MPRSTRRPAMPFVILVALVVMLLAACGGDSGETPGSSAPEVIEVQTRWAFANAVDLSTLIATSDEVFSARVVRQTGTRNEGVLGDAPGRAGSTFPISSYEIAITNSFVGGRSNGSLATYEQPGGLIEATGARVMLDGDPPIEVGKEYLFFTSAKDNGALTAPPYGRLEITSSGRLVAVAQWAGLGALQRLAGVPAQGVEAEIDAAAQ